MLLNAAPGGSVAYDLDSADLRARRTIASSHKDGKDFAVDLHADLCDDCCLTTVNAADPWLAPTTRLVSLEVSAYQPSLGLFVSSRLATWISATGGFRNFVDSRVFRLNTNRFQPSPVFEVVILLFILVQSLSIYAEHSSVTSVRQLLDQPWVMLELTTILVFIAAFVLDTAQLAKMQEVNATGLRFTFVVMCVRPCATVCCS